MPNNYRIYRIYNIYLFCIYILCNIDIAIYIYNIYKNYNLYIYIYYINFIIYYSSICDALYNILFKACTFMVKKIYNN